MSTIPPISAERIQQLELPINRINYHLQNGIEEKDISIDKIGGGVSEDELPALIVYAKEKWRRDESEYRSEVARSALGYIALGAGILAFCWYLSAGDVPGRRQGQLAIGFVMGAASLLYGLFRLVNRDPKWHF